MRRTPPASSTEALRRMQSAQSRDTGPELALRSRLHAAGFRFRVDRPVLPSSRKRADIVFPSRRLAVFVDGCFWHSCPKHRTLPKANAAWWAAKLKRNRERDLETNAECRKAGWRVVRIWEHQPPEQAAAHIISILSAPPDKSICPSLRQRRPAESPLPAASPLGECGSGPP
jgi:DNA mismatch endonuclease, patch repair protein